MPELPVSMGRVHKELHSRPAIGIAGMVLALLAGVVRLLPGSGMVVMSKITSSNNRAKCWWFDPPSGASTFINVFANSGMRSFTPPDSNDCALVIDDAAANLPAPGSVDLCDREVSSRAHF